MKNIKKKIKKVELKGIEGITLSDDQAGLVKHFIVESMRSVYTNQGSLPDKNFEEAAGSIADGIVHQTQMALVQAAAYEKGVKYSKPLKKGKKVVKKTVKKVIKKKLKKKK